MTNANGPARDAAVRDAPLTLGYYIRLLMRRWWIPASLAVLGACLSLVYTGLQDETYRARATVLLTPFDPATADELTRLAPTVSRLVRSDRVLLGARRAYLANSPEADPAATPDDLRARTAVVVPRDTSLFQIAADGPTQRDANMLVAAVVQSAVRSVSSLGARTSASGDRLALGLEGFGPAVPEGRVSPTPVRNLIVGVNVGLLLGIVGAILLRDPRRARMRADDLAQLLRASEVVYAPLPSTRLLRDRPASGAPAAPPPDARGEGIRLLGGRLWQWLQEDRRIVLLLGDLPPQQLRSVALALAAHLSRTGAHPVVVEADFHGSGWDVLRDGGGQNGLGDLLDGAAEAEADGGIPVDTTSRNGDGPGRFTVLPRGERPGEPALAFASERYRAIVERLRALHELVIVVGPATEWQAEVAALAEAADAVVLLVPPWVAHSRAASLATLRSPRTDASIVVSVFGDAEDAPLAASREL